MRTDQLAASIVDDAKKRVTEIKQEIADEVEKIEAETDEILKKKEEDSLEEIEKKEQEEEQRQEAKRERDARITTLTQKRELIDSTFEAAATTLASLKGKEREQLLKKLWGRAKNAMDVGGVIAAKKDATFLKKKSRIVEQRDGIGGFIAVSKDGSVSIDLRFETLLKDVKERDVKEVARILFEEGT